MNDAANGLTAAERTAASLVIGFASVMVLAYLGDRAGLAIHPILILAFSIAAAACCWWRVPASSGGGSDVAAFSAVVVAVVVLLASMSWPALLPIGAGSDLTHHLQLIDFIDQHWRLPYDPATVDLIGNMVNYTPGSHLLASIAGAWIRSDGLHAVYPVMVAATALQTGIVFLIARRVVADDGVGPPMALAAVALLVLPYDYSLGAFVRWSFYAQVVSETCAAAMWLMLVIWDRRPGRAVAFIFGVAGAAAYLSWPVWVGPPVLALTALLLLHPELTLASRMKHASFALAPIGLAAALHAAGRLASIAIVQSGGASYELSASRFGWTLLALAAAGLVAALRRREARATAIVLGAIALQTAVLFAVARAGGADSPYMARKMAHFAVLPMAVLSALALSVVCRAATHRASIGRWLPAPRLAWIALIVVTAIAGRVVSTMPRQAPVITEDLFQAGVWARDHAPSACIDYLVPSDDTSYWLHHAVLRNPMRPPANAPAPVFFYRDAVTRWIAGHGLPFAIADVTIVPREIREEIEPAARFGSIVAGPHRGADEERCGPRVPRFPGSQVRGFAGSQVRGLGSGSRIRDVR